ncbi:PREDICTED: phenolic glucoside malonyltransferase [Prunus dulcis]|uniref:PREDICTED: phenolic glucoside malonyltransferase n=1 Tax=Prunus dulcis TaxID=3755 RepID=A0A5E4FYN8_PRUDU|nr:PREDICTED: phenolic glucoside malonyltransferase [Prunus dulcis]
MPTSSATQLFFDIVLAPKLKTSLFNTLQHYLPLAGHMTWPQNSQKPVLRYVQGDTFSLTIAESGITVFPNCGLLIGTSMHHAILYGKTSTLFAKSWAHICKHGEQSNSMLLDHLKQFYDIRDGPNNRSLMFWERKAPPGSIRGTFQITTADIETPRQLLKAKLAEQKQQDIRLVQVSTFTLASLFGDDGLVVAVNANSEAIRSLEKGVLDGAENWVSRVFAVSSEKMLMLAGSHRSGVYESDFGRGRPKKVEIVSIDRARAISFSDPETDAGAVDVGLVLDKHNMQVSASLFAKGLENP